MKCGDGPKHLQYNSMQTFQSRTPIVLFNARCYITNQVFGTDLGIIHGYCVTRLPASTPKRPVATGNRSLE
jgi:hypothetical protein